ASPAASFQTVANSAPQVAQNNDNLPPTGVRHEDSCVGRVYRGNYGSFEPFVNNKKPNVNVNAVPFPSSKTELAIIRRDVKPGDQLTNSELESLKEFYGASSMKNPNYNVFSLKSRPSLPLLPGFKFFTSIKDYTPDMDLATAKHGNTRDFIVFDAPQGCTVTSYGYEIKKEVRVEQGVLNYSDFKAYEEKCKEPGACDNIERPVPVYEDTPTEKVIFFFEVTTTYNDGSKHVGSVPFVTQVNGKGASVAKPVGQIPSAPKLPPTILPKPVTPISIIPIGDTPPAKGTETPIKTVETPAKPVEAPTKPVETPVKPAEVPVKQVETPVKPVETPAKSAVEVPAKSVAAKTGADASAKQAKAEEIQLAKTGADNTALFAGSAALLLAGASILVRRQRK
ncbi:MAG: LPXTG cell wall anchor domain-containing protein, partial [Microbacteriaceae bacterium]|nr:LPXTG cell wall anchor domain-containing protein [Microbacteriaceae bacterium]